MYLSFISFFARTVSGGNPGKNVVRLRGFRLPVMAALFFSLPSLFAQIGIQVTLNRTVYMQYEPVYACVTLRNDSGKPLLFGNDPRLQGFVLFDIRDEHDRAVPKREGQEISVAGLVLGPGEIKRMIIPINRYYNLDVPQRYEVRAFISHNQLENEYQSKPDFFRVETGAPIWSRTVGLPALDDEKGHVTTAGERTYSLRALQETPNTYYYLVIEDNKKVFGVMRVGMRIAHNQIQAEVDMLSRIHLLVPLSPKVFHYLSFSVDGLNTENSFWKTTSTIPMLYRDPATGKVSRVGGAPARVGVDFKDPNAGKLTAAQLLDEDGEVIAPTPVQPTPPSSKLLDVGQHVGQ